MKKEKVNELLTEIRNHDASNTLAVFKYTGEEQNNLAEKLNEAISKKYTALSDEEIFKMLEQEPDDHEAKQAIQTIVMSIAEEVSQQPEIRKAFRHMVDVYYESSWEEINKLFRLVQFLLRFFEGDQLRFPDANDVFAQRIVEDFMKESSRWDQEKLKDLIENHWEKVDYMTFMCCYIINQMKLNGILIAHAMEAMLRLVLRQFYLERNLHSVMLDLGENKFSFAKNQMEQKCTVEFIE